MKPPLIAMTLLLAGLCSCTTLSNRRDMYSPQTVMGPYTRMVRHELRTTTVTTITQTSVSQTSDGKSVRSR
ncbi:MAG: hypothetical protein ABI615_00790 [Chthoniobacterales bacterium]